MVRVKHDPTPCCKIHEDFKQLDLEAHNSKWVAETLLEEILKLIVAKRLDPFELSCFYDVSLKVRMF